MTEQGEIKVFDVPEMNWTFSWRSADHSQGMVRDTFSSRADANSAREFWANRREMTEHATFVHETA